MARFSFFPSNPVLAGRSIAGAAVALVLILFFILNVAYPDPAWGAYWKLRPLIITPLAGAFGGAVFHFILETGRSRNMNRYVILPVAILTFMIIIWLGIILGLDGTLWD